MPIGHGWTEDVPILFKNPRLHPSLVSSLPSRCFTLTPGETYENLQVNEQLLRAIESVAR